jgi:diguanylate cyclase (GGDEF)-like protein
MPYFFLALTLSLSTLISATTYFGLHSKFDLFLLWLPLTCAGIITLLLVFYITLDRQRQHRITTEKNNQRLSLLLEHGSSAILLLNQHYEIKYKNDKNAIFDTFIEHKKTPLFKIEKWLALVEEDTQSSIRQSMIDNQAWLGDLQFDAANPDSHFSVSITPILDRFDQLDYFIIRCKDISEHKAIANRLFTREHYNSLTDLPNRQFALQFLQTLIEKSKLHNHSFYILHIDLDRIRYINESLGHQVVDNLLIETAERLRRCVRDTHLLAHLGADEFFIALDQNCCHEEVCIIADAILDQCRRAFHITTNEINISASIGLSQYPKNGRDTATLMRRAEAAMFNAKTKGNDRFCFYEEGLSNQTDRRLDTENQLRHAIERNEFKLHYQPVVDLNNNQLSGVEVLLRWNNADLNNPGPDEFIPIAEQSGQIIAIGNWVLEQACCQAMRWTKAGLPPIKIAVNISSKQFTDGDIVNHVRTILKQSGLPASLLELEITEGVLINDAPNVHEIFHELKSFGVNLSLDDFGTGYASLSYLKRYPFNILKIDRSFVHDIDNNIDDVTLTNAIIVMAHSFKMKVIAEGVENLQQRRLLRERNCDMVQGYLYSPALPAEQFMTWAKNYSETQYSNIP